jgi:hypothetical protein
MSSKKNRKEKKKVHRREKRGSPVGVPLNNSWNSSLRSPMSCGEGRGGRKWSNWEKGEKGEESKKGVDVTIPWRQNAR